MAGRIRSLIVLVIVICLIYIQQSFVLYAEDITEVLPGSESAQQKEMEKTGEESKEDPEESPEEKPEEKPEEEPEEEPEEKTEVKPMRKYQIRIPKEDGSCGYYITKPEIKIMHIGESGRTLFSLSNGKKLLEKGVLQKDGEEVCLKGKVLEEGENILYTWMTGEDGDEKKFEETRKIRIDTTAPELQAEAPEGFERWYQKKVELTVYGKDKGSGISNITCQIDGKMIGKTDGEKGKFVIDRSSVSGEGVEVTVVAKDRAGNRFQCTKKIYIDQKSPEISVRGVKNFSVLSEPVTLVMEVEEENLLQEYSAEIEWENTDGEKTKIPVKNFLIQGQKKSAVQSLKKDGVYRVKVYGKDMAGHTSAEKIQVIIDRTNPVIRHVDMLNGKYMKFFSWEYPVSEMVKDFTSCTCEIRLDGTLYETGKKIEKEGKHTMEVKVIDAAGNQSQAEAAFYIDHTPPEILFENIEYGGTYEEGHAFAVRTDEKKDRVTKIEINGKRQKIPDGKNIYRYTLNRCQDYEVIVEACDFAGNFAEKRMYFQIVPEPTPIEKATEPIVKYFRKNTAKEVKKSEEEKVVQEDRKIPMVIWLTGLATAGILAVAIGTLVFRKYCRKKAEEKRIS